MFLNLLLFEKRSGTDEQLTTDGETMANIIESIVHVVNEVTGNFIPVKLVNQTILGIAKVTELKIDRKTGRLDVSLQLEGDEGTISVTINDYQLGQDEHQGNFKFSVAECTKPWLMNLMNKHMAGKWLTLPEGLTRTALKMTL